jgi:hypothetical protein
MKPKSGETRIWCERDQRHEQDVHARHNIIPEHDAGNVQCSSLHTVARQAYLTHA